MNFVEIIYAFGYELVRLILLQRLYSKLLKTTQNSAIIGLNQNHYDSV